MNTIKTAAASAIATGAAVALMLIGFQAVDNNNLYNVSTVPNNGNATSEQILKVNTGIQQVGWKFENKAKKNKSLRKSRGFGW